jgi:hypothetical protein
MLADPSGHLIAGIAVSNSAEVMDVRPLFCCVLCAQRSLRWADHLYKEEFYRVRV